jgi:cytochrome c oxidase subunit 2
MIESLVQQASSFAGNVDGIILLVFWIVLAWLIAAEGIFFWLIFKFRAVPNEKSQYITGKEKHLKRWITVPHAFILLFDIWIVAIAVQVWYNVKIQSPEPESTVRVIGQQWAWIFQHPGADNVLDTADDITMLDELHVQVDRTYQYQLESRDVLHDFSVPVFRLKQDAIPGRRILGWFRPTEVGEHDIQCAEICGIGHGVMGGRIFIETPEEHAAWVAANTPEPGSPAAARPDAPTQAPAASAERRAPTETPFTAAAQ